MDWDSDLPNQQIPWMAMGVIVLLRCVIGLSMARVFHTYALCTPCMQHENAQSLYSVAFVLGFWIWV